MVTEDVNTIITIANLSKTDLLWEVITNIGPGEGKSKMVQGRISMKKNLNQAK